MDVRAGVVVLGLGVLAAACAGNPRPAEVSPPPSRTTVLTTPSPAPGVSWLRLSPQEGLRGATVKLDVACLDELGPVQSPVFDVGALQPDPSGHQPWHVFGTATVRPDAAFGPHQVAATCGAQQLSATFTVVPHP